MRALKVRCLPRIYMNPFNINIVNQVKASDSILRGRFLLSSPIVLWTDFTDLQGQMFSSVQSYVRSGGILRILIFHFFK